MNFPHRKFSRTEIAVQIFLLALIIIGIILLCTQNLWVPSVVTAILAGQVK